MDFRKFFEELDKAVDEDDVLYEQVKEFIEKMRTLTYEEAIHLHEVKWLEKKHNEMRKLQENSDQVRKATL